VTLDDVRTDGDLRTRLRVRVVRCSCSGAPHWYADIDDAADPQPDDPFWYVDRCPSQTAALDQACTKLAGLDEALRDGALLTRVLESRLVAA
jgi:hypothetical protein